MQASKNGIEISKAELGLLLHFAGGPTKDGVVKFRIAGSGRLTACSGDGKKSVEVIAKAGDAEDGEWAVPATFLETLRRGINKGKTEAILEVNGKGLKHARLRGAASKDKQIGIEDESNGTSTQLSIDKVHKELESGSKQLSGSWFAFLPKNFARPLDVMSKAADGCPITAYPPKEATDHVYFEASCEGGRFRCMLPTAAVVAPGDEADEDDDEPAPGKPAKQAALPGTELATQKRPKRAKAAPPQGASEEDGGVVDNDYKPDGAVEGGKKARKKAAKKK